MIDDCPDVRGLIEWRTAREYERMAEVFERDGMEAPASFYQKALYYYLLFWSEVTT